jgi:hypothetical protein
MLAAEFLKLFLVFFAYFHGSFQAVCDKGRGENEYFFYSFFGQFLDGILRVGFDPRIFSQSRLEAGHHFVFRKP